MNAAIASSFAGKNTVRENGGGSGVQTLALSDLPSDRSRHVNITPMSAWRESSFVCPVCLVDYTPVMSQRAVLSGSVQGLTPQGAGASVLAGG